MVMPLEKGKTLIENDPQLEALWSVAWGRRSTAD
jgi:hypothetical protein